MTRFSLPFPLFWWQVPGDLSQTSEDQSLSDFEISNRALINVWIPSVFLRGKAANAFHVYQVSTWFSVRHHRWGGRTLCDGVALLPPGDGVLVLYQEAMASERQHPSCPASLRKWSFVGQTEASRAELSAKVRPLSVALTPQPRLLEQN